MPIRLPKTPNRRSPAPEEGAPTPQDRHQRLFEDESHRRLREVADAVSDKRDEIQIVSQGEGVEVRVENSLGFVPNRAWATDCPYPYTAGKARPEDLADDEWIYLKTNAPAGTKIRVRFDRVEED